MTEEKPGSQCRDDRTDHLRDEIKASLEGTTGPANPDSQRDRGIIMTTTDVAPAKIITISEAPIARGPSKTWSCSDTQPIT